MILRRVTERIWLRAIGTPPKFPFGKLQIRSRRYLQCGISRRKEHAKRHQTDVSEHPCLH